MRHQAARHAVGVIPARHDSQRFPGKPLALIAGRMLVERVHERAREARRLDRLVVATDDARIAAAVAGFGGEAIMTSSRHLSGTDRLAEVAASLEAEIYVNIQGDEPLVDPADVDLLVERLDGDPGVEAATLASPLPAGPEADDPNVVKVVCDARGRALYFSRSPVPHARGAAPAARLRHVGLYAYRRGLLLEFAAWPPGALELAEGLEQLRILERGRAIAVVPARGRYHAVDTPSDVEAVERALRDRGAAGAGALSAAAGRGRK